MIPRTQRRLANGFVLVMLLLVGPTSIVLADDTRGDEDSAWMVSLGFHTGAYTQGIDGRTTSTESAFDPGTGDSFISTTVGFETQVHTPLRLDEIVTKPRVVLTGGFHYPLADGLIAERIGESFNRTETGGLNPAFVANCPDEVPAILGGFVGSETCSLRVRNRVSIDAMWYVGLGVDLTLPFFDDQFHILPSISYYGMSVQSVGEFERTATGDATADDFVETANVVGDPELWHGISPAVTFLVDVYEDGPYRWSMFVNGRWVFFLDDPDLESGTRFGTNELTFISTMDDNAPQITAGFQVLFKGFGGSGRR